MALFRVWSDLHLETGSWDPSWFENAAGQYLILAGDINEIVKTTKQEAALEFFKRCDESFLKVFYVAGNHEMWGTYVEKWDTMQAFFESKDLNNIVVLQKGKFELEDLTIFGATMWYDAAHLNNGMPRAVLKQDSKDFQYIKTNRRGTWSGVWPIDIVFWNYDHINWLKAEVSACTTKKLVVTHHAPTPFSKDPGFDNDHKEYVNDLDLTEIPADFWVHGHVHYSHYYIVDDVTVVSNPRGYEMYDAVNARFNPQFTIEI